MRCCTGGPLEKGKATQPSILAWRIPWTVIVHGVAKGRTRLSDFHFHSFILGFPSGSDGEESACHVGDLGSIPRLERTLGEGKGYPLQYSDVENS